MKDTLLGKTVEYAAHYNPELLCPIDRQSSRATLGIKAGELPFDGVDIWNAYELSWLNLSGKPIVACAEFRFSCDSQHIVESKSFKLYLNSFNQTKYSNIDEVEQTLIRDLSACVKADVEVSISAVEGNRAYDIVDVDGECLDDLDIEMDSYQLDSGLLTTSGEQVEETLYSHLLRSLCPVTGQPDWGSIIVSYRGEKIDQQGLLRYLVSYRQHQEFHEQCVERIFVDISARCKPSMLSVYARYQRRGGLDINPYRSNTGERVKNCRLLRQ